MSGCCPPSNAWSHITGGSKQKQLPVISGLCPGLLLYPTCIQSVCVRIRADDKRTAEQTKLLMSTCFSWLNHIFWILQNFTILFTRSVKKQNSQLHIFDNRDAASLLLSSNKILSWNCLGGVQYAHTNTTPWKQNQTEPKTTSRRAQLLPPTQVLLVENMILRDDTSLRRISLSKD